MYIFSVGSAVESSEPISCIAKTDDIENSSKRSMQRVVTNFAFCDSFDFAVVCVIPIK